MVSVIGRWFCFIGGGFWFLTLALNCAIGSQSLGGPFCLFFCRVGGMSGICFQTCRKHLHVSWNHISLWPSEWGVAWGAFFFFFAFLFGVCVEGVGGKGVRGGLFACR